MNSVIHSSPTNRLTAPGRMDVVQRIIGRDPFFTSQMVNTTQWGRKNRRGIKKEYDDLTVAVVMELAKKGLDAVTMRRDELIAFAFLYCKSKKDSQMEEQRAVAA